MEDWIDWRGGSRPVSGATMVEIRLRCRELSRGAAGNFNWSFDSGPYAYEGDDDIIAYRVIKEPTL